MQSARQRRIVQDLGSKADETTFLTVMARGLATATVKYD